MLTAVPWEQPCNCSKCKSCDGGICSHLCLLFIFTPLWVYQWFSKLFLYFTPGEFFIVRYDLVQNYITIYTVAGEAPDPTENHVVYNPSVSHPLSIRSLYEAPRKAHNTVPQLWQLLSNYQQQNVDQTSLWGQLRRIVHMRGTLWYKSRGPSLCRPGTLFCCHIQFSTIVIIPHDHSRGRVDNQRDECMLLQRS